MPCVPFSNGTSRGFICGPGLKRAKPCRCGSGLPADLLCDWKVTGAKSGTCDAPICATCSTAPEEGKDLCPAHSIAFKAWLEQRGINDKGGSAPADERGSA